MNITLIILIVTLITVIVIMSNLTKSGKPNNKLYGQFFLLTIAILIHLLGLILQVIFANTKIPPIYFDYISYAGGTFTPVILLAIAMLYKNKKANLKKIPYLCILPIISLFILWTNDLHHLFYVNYSVNIGEVDFGIFLYIHTIYSYVLFIIAFATILIESVKKSGFISSQTGFILLGVMAPLVPNILGTLKIVPMSIYVTPILYTVTAICFYIAIIKLKALSIIPVTFKTIIDTMSDAFVVISEDGTIADLNKTFIDKFKGLKEFKNKENLFDILENTNIIDVNNIKQNINETVQKETTITKEYHIKRDTYDKFFEIDFQPIKSKDNKEYVATLILLRDITNAKKDMEILMKNESLVMLGELAGGVAHDINTPISAIKSGLLMFKDIAKSDDEKMLVDRMDSCANKIVALTNSLRNQIRNIGSDEISDVNITNVVKDVSIIIHNELVKYGAKLDLDIKQDIVVKGNSAKLSQVVTNIIVNAIQAYENKGGQINICVQEENGNAVISIQDFAGGIPEKIRESIGKNILTTKGVSGTGFGLYLAYSVIKGAFGGEIHFETKVGEGTTFYISIPMTRVEEVS